MRLIDNVAGVGLIVVVIAGVSFTLSNPGGTDEPAVGPPVLPDGLSPARPRRGQAKPPAAQFSADAYGQFWIAGTANGGGFQFLADTGASDVTSAMRVGSALT